MNKAGSVLSFLKKKTNQIEALDTKHIFSQIRWRGNMHYSAKFNCTEYFGVVMRFPLSSKLFQTHETYIYTHNFGVEMRENELPHLSIQTQRIKAALLRFINHGDPEETKCQP